MKRDLVIHLDSPNGSRFAVPIARWNNRRGWHNCACEEVIQTLCDALNEDRVQFEDIGSAPKNYPILKIVVTERVRHAQRKDQGKEQPIAGQMEGVS
jgi:hypothetical protein